MVRGSHGGLVQGFTVIFVFVLSLSRIALSSSLFNPSLKYDEEISREDLKRKTNFYRRSLGSERGIGFRVDSDDNLIDDKLIERIVHEIESENDSRVPTATKPKGQGELKVVNESTNNKPSNIKDNRHSAQLNPPWVKSVNSNLVGISGFTFIVITVACAAVAVFAIVGAGFCFYRLQKNSKAAADIEYPAYGVTGPNKDTTSPSGDRKLAQSAQMYHYQHQKQQMIALEKASNEHNQSASDVDSEEENEEGDYTVYECPGLAPTGEMEVKNPLFNEQPTPTSPSLKKKDPENDSSSQEKESTNM